MDSVFNDKPFIYRKVEQKIYLSPNENKHAKHKSHRDSRSNNSQISTAIIGAGIPAVFSVAAGVNAKGNTAHKTNVALAEAKKWGLFLAGAFLVYNTASVLLNNTKSGKKLAENHPFVVLTGVTGAAFAVGRASVQNGKKLLSKIFNKSHEKKLAEYVKNSSIVRNKTYKRAVEKVSEFSKSSKGSLFKQASTIGLAIVAAKSIFDFGKSTSNYSKPAADSNNIFKTKKHPEFVFTQSDEILLFSPPDKKNRKYRAESIQRDSD